MQPLKKNDSSLSDLLKQFQKQEKIKPAMYQKRLETLWAEIMGVAINRNTRSLRVRDRKLYITVTSASLKQELHFTKPEMLKRFNEILEEDYLLEIHIVS